MPEIAELPAVARAVMPEVETFFRVSHSHRQARYPRPSRPRLAGNHVADGNPLPPTRLAPKYQVLAAHQHR
jgi:hypothetical protein